MKQDIELENLRHKNKMIEIESEKKPKMDVENLKFQNDLTLQRIKTAEIRKNFERKQDIKYMVDYPNDIKK